jgi:hypothetical protein
MLTSMEGLWPVVVGLLLGVWYRLEKTIGQWGKLGSLASG